MPREIPKRLVNYAIAFIISLVGFFLFIWFPSIDAIIFIAFAIASLALVYSMDVLPKSDDLLEIPQVHHYYKQRINSYGYAMAAMLVVISVLYSILAVFLNIRSGVVALILWAVAIVATYFIGIIFASKVEENSTLDFVVRKTADTQEDVYKLKVLIDYLNVNKVDKDNLKFHEKNISLLCSQIELKQEIAEEATKIFLEYKEATSTKLTSSEINAINKR